MRELIPIIIAISAPILESYIDAKKTKKIEHSISALVRFIFAFVVSAAMDFISMYYILIFTGILLNVFWIVFDISYNLWKGNSAWYIGSTSKIDQLAQKILGKDGRVFLALKCLILMLLLTAYSF